MTFYYVCGTQVSEACISRWVHMGWIKLVQLVNDPAADREEHYDVDWEAIRASKPMI